MDGMHAENRAEQRDGNQHNHRHDANHLLDRIGAEELAHLLQGGIIVHMQQVIRIHHIGVVPVVHVPAEIPGSVRGIHNPLPEGLVPAVQVFRALFPQFGSLFRLLKRIEALGIRLHRRLTACIPTVLVHDSASLLPFPRRMRFLRDGRIPYAVWIRLTSAPRQHS